MERQTRTQNRRNHNLVVGHHHFGLSQRGLDQLRFILQRLADLVGHHLACPFEIAPKAHTVTLHVDITHLGNEPVQQRILPIQYRYHLFSHVP